MSDDRTPATPRQPGWPGRLHLARGRLRRRLCPARAAIQRRRQRRRDDGRARCRVAGLPRQRGGDPRLLEEIPRADRHLMDETALRLGVGELIAAYADCIDDDRLEEWPDFFVENCRYLITDHQSHAAGPRPGILYCAPRGMPTERVMAMRRANIYEAQRYRHIVGPVRIDRVEDGIAESRCNFIAVRIMHDGD